MKVLITGAWGNLGVMCVEQALANGYRVRCFDLAGTRARVMANQYQARYPGKLETLWGDITSLENGASLLQGVDAIIHNASALPPLTETRPDLAFHINVGGTRRLIRLAEQTGKPLPFIFPSSVTVFGKPREVPSFKTLTDNTIATDNYTQHKLTCENLLQQSALSWCILRVGVSVDSRTTKTDLNTLKHLLMVNPENSLEYVHPRDVALAMINAIKQTQTHRRTLLIGGGPACQVTQERFINAALTGCGLRLKRSNFGLSPYYTHWMDTAESQHLLDYQHHSFSDYQKEMRAAMKHMRLAVLPVRPLANWLLNRWVAQLCRA